jgi:hypothetical protein
LRSGNDVKMLAAEFIDDWLRARADDHVCEGGGPTESMDDHGTNDELTKPARPAH